MARKYQRHYQYDDVTEQRIDLEGYDWFRAGVLVLNKSGKKFLVIQEAKGWIRGLWNIPVGHVKRGETLEEAAIREAKEESGYTCKLTGVCHIGQRCDEGNPYVAVIFTAIAYGPVVAADPENTLKVDWKPLVELKRLARQELLRNDEMVLEAAQNVMDNTVGPLEMVKVYQPRC